MNERKIKDRGRSKVRIDLVSGEKHSRISVIRRVAAGSERGHCGRLATSANCQVARLRKGDRIFFNPSCRHHTSLSGRIH